MTTLAQTIRDYQKLLRQCDRKKQQLERRYEQMQREAEIIKSDLRSLSAQAVDLRAVIHTCVATGSTVTEVKLKYTVHEMHQHTRRVEAVINNTDDLFYMQAPAAASKISIHKVAALPSLIWNSDHE